MLILSSGKTCLFLWLWVWNAGYPGLVWKGPRKNIWNRSKGFDVLLRKWSCIVSIEESEHLELGTGCVAEGWGIVITSSLRMRCQVGSDAATEGRTKRWGWTFVVGRDDSSFGQHWGLQAILFYDTEHILKSVRMGVEACLYIILTFFPLPCSCLLCSLLLLLVVIFICRQNSILWIVFQECLRHVIVEKECWSDLALSWSCWQQNTRVCDKEGCVGLDLTRREVLLFRGNILLLSFPAFSLLTSCWIVFLL